MPLPETLLDSCWKVVLEIRGVKSDNNRVPVRLTFCCKFAADDNILEVEQDHRFVKRWVTSVAALTLCVIAYYCGVRGVRRVTHTVQIGLTRRVSPPCCKETANQQLQL